MEEAIQKSALSVSLSIEILLSFPVATYASAMAVPRYNVLLN